MNILILFFLTISSFLCSSAMNTRHFSDNPEYTHSSTYMPAVLPDIDMIIPQIAIDHREYNSFTLDFSLKEGLDAHKFYSKKALCRYGNSACIIENLISDEHWQIVAPLLPPREIYSCSITQREFINIILTKFQENISWRDLKATHYTLFSQWAKKEIWEAIYKHLLEHSENYLKISEQNLHAYKQAALYKIIERNPSKTLGFKAELFCHNWVLNPTFAPSDQRDKNQLSP